MPQLKKTYTTKILFVVVTLLGMTIGLIRCFTLPTVFDNGWIFAAGVIPMKADPPKTVDEKPRYGFFDKKNNCVLIVDGGGYLNMKRSWGYAYLSSMRTSSRMKFVPRPNSVAVLTEGKIEWFEFSDCTVRDFWNEISDPTLRYSGSFDLLTQLEQLIDEEEPKISSESFSAKTTAQPQSLTSQ